MTPEQKTHIAATMLLRHGEEKLAAGYNKEHKDKKNITPKAAIRYCNWKPTKGYKKGPPPEFFNYCLKLRSK